MRNAELIAGQDGLLNEVTWAVPDLNLQLDNWIMPGLMVVATTAKPVGQDWIDYYSSFLDDQISGVICLKENTGGVPNITEKDLHEVSAWHNERNLPLIVVSGKSSITSFLKNFAFTAGSWFRQETQRSNWLQEICADSHFIGADSLAKHHNYNSEYDYYAAILAMKRSGRQDRVLAEMELSMANSFLQRELGFKDAPVLSFFHLWRCYRRFPAQNGTGKSQNISRARRTGHSQTPH